MKRRIKEIARGLNHLCLYHRDMTPSLRSSLEEQLRILRELYDIHDIKEHWNEDINTHREKHEEIPLI